MRQTCFTRRIGSVLAIALLCGVAAVPVGAEALAAGDRAWAARAATLDGERADAEPVREAIRLYREAMDADPGSLAARWRLLRALHYASEFTSLPEEAQDAYVTEAIDLARDSATRIEAGEGSAGDRAGLLFWSAIAWGARAQRVGLLTLVREGAANRMRELAEQSLELDPGVDRGGPLRLLARLHASLPRVPFVTGWVDRDRALPYAERGYALDASHPGNRMVLALTLLDCAPGREEDARALLQSVVDAELRAAFLAEDLRIRREAAERLEELGPSQP